MQKQHHERVPEAKWHQNNHVNSARVHHETASSPARKADRGGISMPASSPEPSKLARCGVKGKNRKLRLANNFRVANLVKGNAPSISRNSSPWACPGPPDSNPVFAVVSREFQNDVLSVNAKRPSVHSIHVCSCFWAPKRKPGFWWWPGGGATLSSCTAPPSSRGKRHPTSGVSQRKQNLLLSCLPIWIMACA